MGMEDETNPRTPKILTPRPGLLQARLIVPANGHLRLTEGALIAFFHEVAAQFYWTPFQQNAEREKQKIVCSYNHRVSGVCTGQ